MGDASMMKRRFVRRAAKVVGIEKKEEMIEMRRHVRKMKPVSSILREYPRHSTHSSGLALAPEPPHSHCCDPRSSRWKNSALPY